MFEDQFSDTAKRNLAPDTAGEIRSNWQYVVAPGSYVKPVPSKIALIPMDEIENAGKYTVLDARSPATITYDEFPRVYKDVHEKNKSMALKTIEKKAHKATKKMQIRHSNEQNRSALWDLDITDVTGICESNKRIPSIFHGSDTGANTSVQNGLLHCWRHGVSHTPFTALTVMAGIASCNDGYRHNSGGFCNIDIEDGETVFSAWKYAKENGMIHDDDPIPTSALVHYALSEGYCKESDVVDGWKLPADVYNKVVDESPVNLGRQKTKIVNQEEKDLENKMEDMRIERYPEYIVEWANILLNKGDSFKFIVDTWNRHHVGDRTIGESCACAVASTYMVNSSGLHIKPSGDSGKGKSDGAKKFLHLLPNHKKLCGSLSGKSMFYNPNLTKGTIIYTDDVQLNDDITTTVKQSITNFQDVTTHNTVKKQEYQQYSIPPRISWWMTSVSGFDDDQMGNRFLGVDVDGSSEQDKKVFEHQAKMERFGITENIVDDDVLVCRAVFSILGEEEDYKIVFPYTDIVDWNNKDNRRNFGMFMDILKSVAFYNIRQREKFHDVYLATINDFYRAKEIYKGLAESNATNLTDRELKVMRWISGKNEVDIKQIAELIGKSETTAKYLMHGRDGKGGLLAKVAGLSSESVTVNIDDIRKTQKKLYKYNNSFGIDSYEDIVNIDMDNIETEYRKFKEEYSFLVSKGVSVTSLSHGNHITCDSDKSTTIDRIYNTIQHTITQKDKMYSGDENPTQSTDHHKSASRILTKMCESGTDSEIVCDSDVMVCDSDTTEKQKLVLNWAKDYEHVCGPINSANVSGVAMEYCRKHNVAQVDDVLSIFKKYAKIPLEQTPEPVEVHA